VRHWIESIDDWNGFGLLSLMGPTGSGKTTAALGWVNRHHANRRSHPLLVSIDAVALYRGLDIGSAKPLGVEREGYDWAGLDLFAPSQRVSVAEFTEYVKPIIQKALRTQRPVLLVGGSHFYEKALVDGMSPGDPTDEFWTAPLRDLPGVELKARLVALDPRWRDRVHENDRYRLLRFLDLADRQGLSYDALFHDTKRDALVDSASCLALGLEFTPDELRLRLAQRLGQMFQAGWGSEVQGLLRAGLVPDAPGLLTVGYREIVAALTAKKWNAVDAPPAELVEEILTAHLQLAKKQKSWVRALRARSQ